MRRQGRRTGQEYDRARLRELSDEMRSAAERADVPANSRTNQLVHRAVRDISGHQTAGLVLDRLRTQSVRYHFRVALLPRRPGVGLREHLDVIDAVCSGDPDAAEQTMRAHLLSVVRALQELAKPQPGW